MTKEVRTLRKRSRRKRGQEDEARDEDGATTATTVRWWRTADGASCAGQLWTWIDRLRPRWALECIADLIHEAIYADRPLGTGNTFDGTNWMGAFPGAARSPLNAIKGIVDTATARLSKVRTMPVVSADDADYDEKLFAKETSRILRRKMGKGKFAKETPLYVRDMCIRGDGVWKVLRCGGDVEAERIPVYELVVDPREAFYGDPRTIAHVRPMAREVLVEEFGDDAEDREAIEKAAPFKRRDPWMLYVYEGPSFVDHVEVAESWHLPSGPDADDGQHVICIRGRVLFREPWKRPRFPIARASWTPPIRTFRGAGLVEELSAAQEFINEIFAAAREGITDGMHLKVFVARGSNVVKDHLRADGPALIEYDGVEPHYIAPDPVSKQAWSIALEVFDKMYVLSGVSQGAAASKSPLGNNVSGKALDTMDDFQSDRFAHVENEIMQGRVEVGRLFIDEAKAMYDEAHADADAPHAFEEHGDRISEDELAPWIKNHPWDKVDIDGGAYHLTLEGINFVTGARGGKLEEAAEAAKAGLIPDPSMTAALFDEPDMQRMNRPILGPFHQIERQMQLLTQLEISYEEAAPDEYQNLALALLMAKGELGEAIADEASEAIVDRFRRYINDVKRLQQLATPASAAPSLAGAQDASTIAQPNAMTLQPGMGQTSMGPPGMPPGAGMPMPQGAAA